MTLQEVLDNQPARYERLLPGHPKPGNYTLTNISPYKLHQRCAERFRVGRICLAGDAAHLCNPWGGLGLTGGFADVTGLAECLEGIATGQADDGILDKYDEVRRSIFLTVIDPISTANFLRISNLDSDAAITKDPFCHVRCGKEGCQGEGENGQGTDNLFCFVFILFSNNHTCPEFYFSIFFLSPIDIN